jgi:hypothetical protein
VTQPQELKEYQYVVNNMITTALLTEEMAERLNAVPVGETPAEKNGGYTSKKNARVYGTTHLAAAVEGGEATEPIREQQQGVDDEGRTASARRTIHDYDDTRPADTVSGREAEAGKQLSEVDEGDEKAVSSPNKARRQTRDK